MIADPDQKIINLFQQASYHFADDSTSEWQKGYRNLDLAAEIIFEQQYPLYRIKEMIQESRSLVDLDTMLTRILKLAYKAS